jgi:CubicO group peptidase (beta-lactamase class C family)
MQLHGDSFAVLSIGLLLVLLLHLSLAASASFLSSTPFEYYHDSEDVYRKILEKVDFQSVDDTSEPRRELSGEEADSDTENNNNEVSIEMIKQEAQHTMEINNVNGMVVSITTANQNLQDTCFALGKPNLKSNDDMTCENLFQIGSVSKSITSLVGLYAHHVEALDVNEQIRRYFPEYNPHDTGNEGASLQDALNHLTGLPRHDSIWQEPYGLRIGVSRKTIVDLVQYLQHSSPIRYKFTYNNIMYTVAGEAIAKALNSWHKQNNLLDPTELSFSEWMEEVVFSTLNMTSTYAEFCRVPPSLLPKMVTGYGKKGSATENNPRERMNLASVAPAAAIISNGNDMLKYMKNFIAEISDDEVGSILKNDYDVYRKPLQAVALSGRGHGIFQKDAAPAAYSYGLNIEYIDTAGYHTQVLQHGGNVYGFSSLIAYIPSLKFGIFVNVNQDKSVAPLTIVKRVIEKMLGIADDLNGAKYQINDLNRRFLKAHEEVHMEGKREYMKLVNEHNLVGEDMNVEKGNLFSKNFASSNDDNEDAKDHRRQLEVATSKCLQGNALQEYIGVFQHPGYGKIEILLNPEDTTKNTINMHYTMSVPLRKYNLDCLAEDFYVPYYFDNQQKKQHLYSRGIFFTTINGKGKVIDSIVAPIGASQGTPNLIVFTKKCQRNGIDTCSPGTPPMGMTWVDNLTPNWPLHFPR